MGAKRMDMATKKRLALEHLHESKAVFSPKELPNEWYRKKKISKSAFDAVLNELVYDDSVYKEKIGTSQYVWSFKSEHRVQNKNKLNKLEKELKDLEEQTANYE